MHHPLNLENLTNEVTRLTQNLTSYLNKEITEMKQDIIEVKGLHNFVTYVDKNAEHQIMQALELLLPEAGFIAEETENTRKGERYNWIIDPLDGTTNYIHGIPLYSISIALLDKNEIVLGVVHEAVRDECFFAWKGSAAFMNGQPISVSKSEKLNDSLMATGFPYYDYSKLDPYLEIFRHMMKYSHGIRRLGSAAADLAYVACGRFEGFYEYGLSSWDVAAGAFIVKAAGGKVSDFNGGSDFIFGREILASNALIHEEILSIMKKYFTPKY